MDTSKILTELEQFQFLKLHFHDEDDFKTIIKHQLRISNLFHIFTTFIYKIAKQPHNDRWNDDEASFTFLLEYLWMMEGMYGFIVNLIIYTLVKCDGVDLYMKNKKHYIDDFYELNKISLHDRAVFISKNGFINFSHLINTNIRNAIAHTSYEINPNGNVIFYDGFNKKVNEKSKNDLHLMIQELSSMSREINMMIAKECDDYLI